MTELKRFAVVGSEEKYWPEFGHDLVLVNMTIHLPKMKEDCGVCPKPTIVTGRCPRGGVDIWAEEFAEKMGYGLEVYEPEVNRWDGSDEGKIGYKQRNLQIARVCDVLYDIEPRDRKWSGGMWTAIEAIKLGKTVHVLRI